MKILTFAVPCYNSEAYMEKCIDSLLVGGEDVEILIVNDGSKDRTAEIADAYAKVSDDRAGDPSGKQRARRCCKCGTRQCHRTLF